MYLTPELKTYYQKELQKCTECKDTTWDLDKGLLSILTNINKNPNIQTILSKKPENIILGNNYSALSYLHITFSENVKTKLIKILNKLYDKFKKEDVQLYLIEDEPFILSDETKKEQKEVLENPNLCNLEVIINAEKYYNNINQIQINLYDDSMKKHKEFWKYLEYILTKDEI